MAEEVTIQGTGSRAKIRNPLAVIALSIVTLGIYFWFWYSTGRVRPPSTTGGIVSEP